MGKFGMVLFFFGFFLFTCLLWGAAEAEAAYGEETLKQGMRGSEVQVLQQQLKALHYNVSVDGVFGPQTREQVVKFQKAHGLKADGVVGKNTFSKLGALSTGAKSSALVKREAAASRSGRVERSNPADGVFEEDVLQHLYQVAEQYLGTPYRYGGMSKAGIDCSGLTQAALAGLGYSLPRRSDDQYQLGVSVKRDELQTGDLVFFSTTGPGVTHVAVYLEKGKLLNATSSSGVVYTSLSERYWSQRYYGAKRVLTLTAKGESEAKNTDADEAVTLELQPDISPEAAKESIQHPAGLVDGHDGASPSKSGTVQSQEPLGILDAPQN